MVICLSSIFSDPLDETGVAALTSLPRKDWAEVSVYPWKQQIRRRQVGTTPGGGGGGGGGGRMKVRGCKLIVSTVFFFLMDVSANTFEHGLPHLGFFDQPPVFIKPAVYVFLRRGRAFPPCFVTVWSEKARMHYNFTYA